MPPIQSITNKFNTLADDSPNMAGIVEKARDLTTAIESRFGTTTHSLKAIHDVLDAVAECQAIERELVNEHLEKEAAAKAVRAKHAVPDDPDDEEISFDSVVDPQK